MGSVKKEWMEQQELSPFYEWIEENYGSIDEEEEPELWKEASEAYDKYIAKLQYEEARYEALEEHNYYMYMRLADADNSLRLNLAEIKAFTDVPGANLSPLLSRLTYAQAVTILETYVQDIIKGLIHKDDSYLLCLLSNSKIISAKSFSLKDLLNKKDDIEDKLKIENLRTLANEHIQQETFHSAARVKTMLESLLGNEIKIDFSSYNKITNIRHHIVHRNGFNFKGEQITLSINDVTEAIKTVENLASQIRAHCDQLNWEPKPPE